MAKVLFVDNSIYEFVNFRGFIVEELIKLDYEVLILVPKYDKCLQSAKLENLGVTIITYAMPGKISLIGDLKLLYTFYNLYKKLQPDLIIHYTIKPNIYGSLAARLNRISSISLVPGLGMSFAKKGIISFIVKKLYKLALSYPEKIWVLNNDDRRVLEKIVTSRAKIMVLPGEGIDVDYFKPKYPYIKGKPFKFLYIGRLIEEKGIKYLINASIELRKLTCDFEVNILGALSGSLSSGSITQKDIDSWVSFGYINYLGKVSDVRESIQSSDCVILPSYYGEGLPRSLMEACSMERVIITTDNVGCKEVLIDGVNGFFCKTKDVVSLKDTMFKILSLSQSEIQEMGKNGRSLMKESFQKEIIQNIYITELNRLLDSK